MTSGWGGLPPRRPDQAYHPVAVGAAPGQASPNVIARIVIIYGTNQGVFLYQGAPSSSNPPVLSLTGPSTTTDPYGNPVTPDGYTVYEPGGVQAIFVGLAAGNIPTIQVGTSGSSLVTINPDVSTPFNITNAIAGTLQSALELTTTDANQMIAGLLGSVLLNSGTSAKMTTVLTSPLNNSTGAALALQCENDGGTDTAVITLGTITTPDDETEIFSPILALYPYALLLYSGASGQTTITKTSGSGTISGLPATVKAEAWGGGGGGGTAANFGAAGAGGGEYAQEMSLATTGSVTYAVGAAGTGGVNGGAASTSGASSTITGSAVTVTAHGGTRGVSTDTPGGGGSGSANTVHYSGGSGGTTVGGKPGGGGGGSSGGTGSAGNAGQEGKTSGGTGGFAVTGGGAGGTGGAAGSNAHAGSAPGGGGGGSGAGGNGGNGGAGQVRITYTTGAPGILASIASAAGADQFGTSYPAETVLPSRAWNYVGAAGQPAFAADWANSGSPFAELAFRYSAETDMVEIIGRVTPSAGAGTTLFTLPAGYLPASDQSIFAENLTTAVAGQATVETTGAVVFGLGITAGDAYWIGGRYSLTI